MGVELMITVVDPPPACFSISDDGVSYFYTLVTAHTSLCRIPTDSAMLIIGKSLRLEACLEASLRSEQLLTFDRRNTRLLLDPRRFEEMRKTVWLNHGIPHAIARKLEGLNDLGGWGCL